MRLTHPLEELRIVHDAGNAASAVSTGMPQPDIIELNEDRLVVCQRVDADHTRDGGAVAGLTLFRLVDLTGYLVTVAQTPKGGSSPFTVDVSMRFLRLAPVGELVAVGRGLRFGKRLSVVDVAISSPLVPDGPVAAATITFAPAFPG